MRILEERRTSSRRRTIAILAAVVLVGAAGSATASMKTLATGVMVYNSGVNVQTVCTITNYGTKAATIAGVAIANQGGSSPAESDGCTNAPLAPGKACLFSGPADSVQGGGSAQVKGSSKDLRGNCTLRDPGGSAVQFDQMR